MKKLALAVLFALAFVPRVSAAETETLSSEKLDRIVEQQEKIMKALDEIREELRVVKVRATNK